MKRAAGGSRSTRDAREQLGLDVDDPAANSGLAGVDVDALVGAIQPSAMDPMLILKSMRWSFLNSFRAFRPGWSSVRSPLPELVEYSTGQQKVSNVAP